MRHSLDPDDYEHDEYEQHHTRRRRRRRFDDEQPERSGRLTEEAKALLDMRRAEHDGPPEGDRWSTYEHAEQGPLPRPGWVVTESAAVDTELGVLKTGKEADVHLLRRGVPGTGGVLLAAKRYRSAEHRSFHRDAGYLEGRRLRRSRELRAIEHRTAFGRNLIAEQWAVAEFAALSRLWTLGAPVPYPVQRTGTELLLEYLGEPEQAAPRLAESRAGAGELERVWARLYEALELLAAEGLTHGDLSAYNVLVRRGEPVLIDLPQVVELFANPNGPALLARDVTNIASWFTARGVLVDEEETLGALRAAAGFGPG